MQDGILKLVADRNKRTLVGNKGDKKDSMVEFYRRLDYLDGKPKCDLEERINVILDEVDNYNRKGMASYIANNRDFPQSIERNISLLYQNLWQPGMTDPSRSHENFGNRYLKIFSCFKHLNGTKLSSHLWFFEGFCRYLNPEYIVLLDVGTKPADTGVVNLLKGFTDIHVGGVTGLMSVDSEFASLEGGDDDDK
jgi:chitin synthase